MQFRSIRWRLVASYMLLTLLTVVAVGVLAISLVKTYADQQERNYMVTTAETIARRAYPLLHPVPRDAALTNLAVTAAFLGDVRVRILDTQRQVLADSGRAMQSGNVIWVLPPTDAEGASANGTGADVGAAGSQSILGLRDAESYWRRNLRAGLDFTIVRRANGPWGGRFVLEPGRGRETQGTPAGDATPVATLEASPVANTNRSDQGLTVPIVTAGNTAGYVELSGGPSFSADILPSTQRALVLAGLSALLLAAVVGFVVSQGMTAPLQELTAVAADMTGGDLSARASERSRDEIGQLARQFNQMAARLEASFAALAAERDALRRFIADASHELRTPITALKTFNELLQSMDETDRATRSEFLLESRTQINRLEWLTANLLDLSRLDAGLVALDMTAEDIGGLLEASCAGFHMRAQERQITLVVNPPQPPVELRCDRARIEMALSNLLDNALKFTPPGGRVEIGARGGERIEIWVQDSGPGVDPAEYPRIFERFYRGRTNGAPGSGLGLSIVRSIVQAHGGHVGVESEVGRGSRFVIRLAG